MGREGVVAHHTIDGQGGGVLEVVEDDNVDAALEEIDGEVRADVAGATSDEHLGACVSNLVRVHDVSRVRRVLVPRPSHVSEGPGPQRSGERLDRRLAAESHDRGSWSGARDCLGTAAHASTAQE